MSNGMEGDAIDDLVFPRLRLMTSQGGEGQLEGRGHPRGNVYRSKVWSVSLRQQRCATKAKQTCALAMSQSGTFHFQPDAGAAPGLLPTTSTARSVSDTQKQARHDLTSHAAAFPAHGASVSVAQMFMQEVFTKEAE